MPKDLNKFTYTRSGQTRYNPISRSPSPPTSSNHYTSPTPPAHQSNRLTWLDSAARGDAGGSAPRTLAVSAETLAIREQQEEVARECAALLREQEMRAARPARSSPRRSNMRGSVPIESPNVEMANVKVEDGLEVPSTSQSLARPSPQLAAEPVAHPLSAAPTVPDFIDLSHANPRYLVDLDPIERRQTGFDHVPNHRTSFPVRPIRKYRNVSVAPTEIDEERLPSPTGTEIEVVVGPDPELAALERFRSHNVARLGLRVGMPPSSQEARNNLSGGFTSNPSHNTLPPVVSSSALPSTSRPLQRSQKSAKPLGQNNLPSSQPTAPAHGMNSNNRSTTNNTAVPTGGANPPLRPLKRRADNIEAPSTNTLSKRARLERSPSPEINTAVPTRGANPPLRPLKRRAADIEASSTNASSKRARLEPSPSPEVEPGRMRSGRIRIAEPLEDLRTWRQWTAYRGRPQKAEKEKGAKPRTAKRSPSVDNDQPQETKPVVLPKPNPSGPMATTQHQRVETEVDPPPTPQSRPLRRDNSFYGEEWMPSKELDRVLRRVPLYISTYDPRWLPSEEAPGGDPLPRFRPPRPQSQLQPRPPPAPRALPPPLPPHALPPHIPPPPVLPPHTQPPPALVQPSTPASATAQPRRSRRLQNLPPSPTPPLPTRKRKQRQ